MATSPAETERQHPDGRVTLARPGEIAGTRRASLGLAGLYRPHGRYCCSGGWNWRAVAALLAGAVLAAGGAWSSPGGGPFPGGGLIPLFKPLCSYSWFVGFGVAFLLYWGLPLIGSPRPATARTASYAGQG